MGNQDIETDAESGNYDQDYYSFISIPQALQLAQLDMDQLLYSTLAIRVKDPTNTEIIDKIAKDLK